MYFFIFLTFFYFQFHQKNYQFKLLIKAERVEIFQVNVLCNKACIGLSEHKFTNLGLFVLTIDIIYSL